MYCHELPQHNGGTWYTNFFSTKICVKMCGNEPILKVQVTEDPERNPNDQNGYWGWWDTDAKYPDTMNQFVFVFLHQLLVNTCFPYGPEIEERLGKGIRLPVKIEVLKEN
jgi:hypothetical protein